MNQQERNSYFSWRVSVKLRELKAKAVEYKGGKCEKCGYRKCLAALVFHHRDRTQKDFGISGKCRTWAKLQPELDKCQLLCHNCHNEHHDAENQIKLEERGKRARGLIPERKLKVDKPKCERERIVRTVYPEDSVFLGHIHEIGVCATAELLGVDRRTVRRRVEAISPGLRVRPKNARKQAERAKWPDDGELRRMLWERPALTIARELGVTSSAVKRRCGYRGIPTPPRGYWAKQRATKSAA
jgi:hypothetical protein